MVTQVGLNKYLQQLLPLTSGKPLARALLLAFLCRSHMFWMYPWEQEGASLAARGAPAPPRGTILRRVSSVHATCINHRSAPGSRGCARTTGDSAHDSSTGAASHGVPLFVGTSERTDRGDAERPGPAATDARGGPRAASVSHESPRPVLPWQTPVETRQRVESTWQGSCNF